MVEGLSRNHIRVDQLIQLVDIIGDFIVTKEYSDIGIDENHIQIMQNIVTSY